jgi:hypothetical protein
VKDLAALLCGNPLPFILVPIRNVKLNNSRHTILRSQHIFPNVDHRDVLLTFTSLDAAGNRR